MPAAFVSNVFFFLSSSFDVYEPCCHEYWLTSLEFNFLSPPLLGAHFRRFRFKSRQITFPVFKSTWGALNPGAAYPQESREIGFRDDVLN